MDEKKLCRQKTRKTSKRRDKTSKNCTLKKNVELVPINHHSFLLKGEGRLLKNQGFESPTYSTD